MVSGVRAGPQGRRAAMPQAALRPEGRPRRLRHPALRTQRPRSPGRSNHVRIPYRGRGKPASQKDANRAHARLRSPGERANAQLKTRRILRKLRCCPWRAGQLAKAIHVLQIRESPG